MLNFLYAVVSTKHIPRMWTRFFGKNIDVDSLAEHHLRVTWIAWLLAMQEKADTNKVIKMALLHDLAEIYTGDVDYLSRQFVVRKEEEGFAALLNLLNMDTTEFVLLKEEYEKRQSLEAKIVKDADNLTVDMEVREQQEKGQSLAFQKEKMRREIFPQKLLTDSGKTLFEQIYQSNPQAWHFQSQHRWQTKPEEKNEENEKVIESNSEEKPEK